MKKQSKIKNQKAYTIVEIVAVMAIIAVLGALSLSAYFSSRRGAQLEDAAQRVVSLIREAKNLALSPQECPGQPAGSTKKCKAYAVVFYAGNTTAKDKVFLQGYYQTSTTLRAGEGEPDPSDSTKRLSLICAQKGTGGPSDCNVKILDFSNIAPGITLDDIGITSSRNPGDVPSDTGTEKILTSYIIFSTPYGKSSVTNGLDLNNDGVPASITGGVSDTTNTQLDWLWLMDKQFNEWYLDSAKTGDGWVAGAKSGCFINDILTFVLKDSSGKTKTVKYYCGTDRAEIQ